MKKKLLPKILKSFLPLPLFSLSILLSLLILNIIIPITYSYQKPVGYVNDFANIIDDDYEQKITQLITDIEKNTSAEIAVVTIKSLEGDSIENYAVKLFEEWGIGKREQDNGLLILVALEDRKYRIELGYGLEASVTDAVAGRIGRAYFVPNFRHGDYGKGVYEAILALKPYIMGESVEVQQEGMPPEVFLFFGSTALSIIYGIILFFYLKRVHKTKKKNRKKLLMALPWVIPFLPLLTLLLLLSFLLFITNVFVYITFIISLFFPKHTGKKSFGPFGVFGRGGFGGGGGFGGFGGGGSGGGGASGGW